MKPGVYSHLTNDEYHAGPGVSKSLLDLVHRSPVHAKYAMDHANDNEPTVAQAFGTAFHTLLLEPAVFAKEYCLALRQQDVPDVIGDRDTLVAMVQELNKTRLPKLATGGTKDELIARIIDAEAGETVCRKTREQLDSMKGVELKEYISHLNSARPGLLSDRGTMAELAETLRANGHDITLWSEVKQTWLENNGHRNVLDADAWEALHNMRDAVMAHPAARALLTGAPGKAEQSVYWIDETTGELCRCRPDFWRQDGIIVDVKTAADASPEGFSKAVANWRYHVQHAFYVDGLNAAREQIQATSAGEEFPPAVFAPVRAFVFLVVEKDACVVEGQAKGVAVYSLDADAVALGQAEARADLDTYAQCKASGVWPGYAGTIQPLALPRWAFNAHPELLAA